MDVDAILFVISGDIVAIAMPQFCFELPDTYLTVQLQIGKERSWIHSNMHNHGTLQTP
jgi:hypothetical protein